ncbi:hypothetical protein RJ639_000709, partial [Escallonia herrerae]
ADTKGTSLKKNDNPTVTSKNWKAYMVAVAVDFLSIFLPLILVSTVLAEWTYVSAICLVLLLLFSAGFKSPSTSQYREGSSRYREDGVLSVRTYISFYRVAMMLVTCLCILAVDFSIFPRRYAKTETYGVSLMDIGVGSFVLANSLVSRQARGIATVENEMTKSILELCKTAFIESGKETEKKLRNAVQSTSPLLFLGFARLISMAGVDYQVHVGEYGVHWNFFFTLAAVSVLTSIINVPPNYSGCLGSSILLGYQVCLKRGLNVYLLSNERGGDIISQNKEGIFSIFVIMKGIGLCHEAREKHWFVGGAACLIWLITILLERHVERPSRRMCNLAYVTLVLASNLQVLAIAMLSDCVPGHKVSVLEKAFDQNLLGSFLLANVLTGLINLFVDTLFVSSVSALIILIVYAFVLSAFVSFADFYGMKLKFW